MALAFGSKWQQFTRPSRTTQLLPPPMKKLKLLLSVCALSIATATSAQETKPPQPSLSPYHARVGDTLFVSGHFIHWFGWFLNTFDPPTYAGKQALISDPIRKVIFVNVVTNRPAETGGAYGTQRIFARHKIDTSVVGDCDIYCARMFALGVTRKMEYAEGVKPATVAFQVPFDIPTGLPERRFPAYQLAPFESFTPEFATKNKDLLTKAFTQPTDDKGGLFVQATGAKYCASANLDTCEAIQGATAFNMGLTTQDEVETVVLPPTFPAPKVSKFAGVSVTCPLLAVPP